jgi:RNA polymerase sigma factor (sigma-70 family)
MLSGSRPAEGENPALLNSTELFQKCAADRENTALWSEFLKRYARRMKQFIRGMLRQCYGSYAGAVNTFILGGLQESDLFQNIIVRLVEKDCAVMKRFSGSTEEEMLAYLAVISRSVVMDAIRRHKAIKRRPTAESEGLFPLSIAPGKAVVEPEMEREILTRELLGMAHQFINSNSGKVSARDRLVFELHFLEGLSLQQISRCKGVNLTKGGVEKLIRRIVDRVQNMASAGRPEATLS